MGKIIFEEENGIEYCLLSEDLEDAALKVIEEGFYKYECVSVCTDIAKNKDAIKELNKLCMQSFKDGVSIVAKEKILNKVVGVSVNKIQVKPAAGKKSFFEEYTENECKTPEARALMEFMVNCDSEVNLFEHYKTNKVMEITFLVVSPEYRRRGIAQKLVECDLELLNTLAKQPDGPQAATTLFTSKFTAKIGEKLHFDVLGEVSYQDCYYNGIKYAEKLDPIHQKTVVLGKRSVV